MSIDILFELQHEVRRLFIAGSGMAAGDLRLQKMLPSLQKLGESAPVFNRLAQAVGGVLEAEAGSSAARLLELGTLLNSVLYTQGKTDTEGELVPVEGTDARLSTRVPYRKLQPVIEALTTKGQGRWEQIRQAYEEGLFEDFRLVSAAVSALDDSYAEIPEYLQRNVLPAYGKEALPALQRQFRIDGGKGDARRLELIHDLLQQASLELLLQAAKEGSAEVRSAAIELLGEYPEQEEFILEQADDRKKEIRRAALFALSRLGTEQAIARLYRALHSRDRDIAIEPVQLCKANDLTLSVIGSAESALERIVRKTDVQSAADELLAAIHSLRGKRVPEVVELLKKLLAAPAFIIPETEAAQEAAAELLLRLDLPEADRFAVTLHEAHNRKFIAYSFKAAVKILPAEDVYERFCHDLKDKRQPAAKELIRSFHEITPTLEQQLRGNPARGAVGSQMQGWDPRWVRLFVKLDEEELVCRLATDADDKVADYLIKKCQQTPNFNRSRTVSMLLALFRIGYRDAAEMLMSVLEGGGAKQFYYLDRTQLALLASLPRNYAERLRAFAESLSYEGMKQQLLDIAEAAAAKPEESEQAGPSEQEEKGLGIWGWIKNKMS